jgi:(S)-2-hydroxy-acid oxidase
MTSPSPPLTLHEVELAGKAKLPKHIYEFYASGSDDEEALRRNVEAFNRYANVGSQGPFPPKSSSCEGLEAKDMPTNSLLIRPRVLVDVSRVETSTKLFGWSSPLPISIAPSAMQKLAGGDGELDVARAAASLGVQVTLSSQSTTSLEDVQAARQQTMKAHGCEAPPPWMQLYLYEDVQKSIKLIRRAEGDRNYPLKASCSNG